MPRVSSEPSPADFAACRALMRGGSRSFHAASRLLPSRVCDAATSLYSFCRVADDVIDESATKDAAIASLRLRLHLAYAGTPSDHPADRALAHVVRSHDIPRALLEALLEGFAWDAERRRYETLDDVTAYATRVAGTVGAMMALLMGTRASGAVARAIDLGVAMQFSNIARDVGEDARAGRLYLPLAWLREVGIDPDEFVASPVASTALSSVVQRLLREADMLYRRADAGIAALPGSCRIAIRAARHLYAAIGHEAERLGADAITRRAVVSPGRKLALLPRALVGGRASVAALALPPLPHAAFLIPLLAPSGTNSQMRGASDRFAWLIELFSRLDQAVPSSHATDTARA